MVIVTFKLEIPEDWVSREDWTEFYAHLHPRQRASNISEILVDDPKGVMELTDFENNILNVEWES